MKKIVFVSHCILNTASKVVLYNRKDIDAEEELRLRFMRKALDKGVQIVQLPCPEFTLYGAKRWGHVSDQFDNPFFRKHCRRILEPVIDQLKEYLSNKDRFEVLGIVGIDGSPSCGVDYTCYGECLGAFDGRSDLEDTLQGIRLDKGRGILMDVLQEMLKENGMAERIVMHSLFAPEPDKCLDLLD
ncbi:MAG: hypothetical protein IJI44_04660 [Erysipelotrichaceae bacterium]|nr:hypothetical protein [Erysipelotrichaceae bacterium]